MPSRALTKDDRALLQQVRPYSPIPEEQRGVMKTTLTWLGRQERVGLKEEQRIADAWRAPVQTIGRSQVAGVIEYGFWLIQLQASVPPGTWLHLFRDARGTAAHALARPIPISVKQAQAYMRIARNPVLANPGVFDALPPHWRTLDELTRVPLAALNKAITRGEIHPAMERADVAALRRLPPAMPSVSPMPLAAEGEAPTEEAVVQALERVIALARRAGMETPAVARLLRARAEQLDAEMPAD
jgi:hypothetical protein